MNTAASKVFRFLQDQERQHPGPDLHRCRGGCDRIVGRRDQRLRVLATIPAFLIHVSGSGIGKEKERRSSVA